ncbi:hypothetical protein ACFSFZ_20435 [Mixta tenebrionis]|uniref:Uncharacterized protein n=1 Tax=Mixta tenebrionis TaxID=2562439 RepID=A0A506V7P5_9GAMM|nr:hypothetical protein [Mixta tenebrionis]TPW41073.1 hypothetical protein FKM52_16415 [Mixta tenebrionis]
MISTLLKKWRLAKAAEPPGKVAGLPAAKGRYQPWIKEAVASLPAALKSVILQGCALAKRYRGVIIRLIARALARLIAERCRAWPVVRQIAEKVERLLGRLR